MYVWTHGVSVCGLKAIISHEIRLGHTNDDHVVGVNRVHLESACMEILWFLLYFGRMISKIHLYNHLKRLLCALINFNDFNF